MRGAKNQAGIGEKSVTENPNSRPLSPSTVGHQSMLSDTVVCQILNESDLQLSDRVQFSRFSRELNNLTDIAMWDRFGARIAKPEFDEIARAFEGVRHYRVVAMRYRERNYAPPKVPIEWFLSVEKWMVEMTNHFAGSRGGRPPLVWETAFLTQLLGLFQAAFDQTPTSSENGRAARFVRAIYREVRITQRRIGFDAKYSEDEKKRLTWVAGRRWKARMELLPQ